MPPKAAQENASVPEAEGLTYDQSEMDYFHAKLKYHATVDDRMASQNNNLISVSETQAKVLKRWEMLRHKEKELTERGESLSPIDRSQLAQCAWRFNQLEAACSKKTAGG